jgi:hypothetical protein
LLPPSKWLGDELGQMGAVGRVHRVVVSGHAGEVDRVVGDDEVAAVGQAVCDRRGKTGAHSMRVFEHRPLVVIERALRRLS